MPLLAEGHVVVLHSQPSFDQNQPHSQSNVGLNSTEGEETRH